MHRQVNSTIIAMVPKIPGADKLTGFRPISLCNTVYKVISKIIVSRLKGITPRTVQNNQVGFVKGRLLCENILLASELVADFNKPGPVNKGCLQIDITKAFDIVDWRFLLNILKAFQLPEIFINWIRLCVTSPHYSVALNGELVGFFPEKKRAQTRRSNFIISLCDHNGHSVKAAGQSSRDSTFHSASESPRSCW